MQSRPMGIPQGHKGHRCIRPRCSGKRCQAPAKNLSCSRSAVTPRRLSHRSARAMRFNGLDLNLLLAFQVLLEERNVTRAARRLNISQPAMSAALSRLREYFQDDILTVQGKQMHPTAQAESLAGPVRKFLADLDALLTRSAAFDPSTTQRTFRLVASDYI